MCIQYGVLIFSIAFFGAMSALIIRRARQQREKAKRATALVKPFVGNDCNSN